MKNQLLTLRAEASDTTRDFFSRAITFRAATADDTTASIECVMATESPVPVLDAERYEVIDEILLASGGQYPAQMPFQKDHTRTVDANLGSQREPRMDGQSWVGRLYFDKNDPNAMKAYAKVRDGHLKDVSIGYRSLQYVDIPAGQTAQVAGKQYTAGPERRLRVTTRYQPKEISLVAIGADQQAKIRGEADALPITPPGDSGRKGSIMDPILRKYLESLGLRSDASEDVAKAFLAGLGGDHKTRADAVAAKTMTLEDAVKPAQRSEKREAGSENKDGDKTRSEPTADQIRAESVRVERERVKTIREAAGTDADPETVRQAIDEGWSVERSAVAFLKAHREGRSPSVAADGNAAPGGIVRNHERDCGRESLGLALFMRSGETGDAQLKAATAQINARRNKAGLAEIKFDNLAQMAQRYDDMSLVDVCREAIRLDGKTCPTSRDDTIRSAVSGGSLTQIFTTSVNAMILTQYEEYPDTTEFAEESDVADFKTNTAIRFNANAALKKVGRGQKAEHANTDDSAETYKIARYGKQWAVDEQDIIDDSMNAFADVPREFGQAAARLRPDLVYAMILANPTMADTGAAYNSTALTTAGGHANNAAAGTDVLGGALSANTLQAAIVAMSKQYRGSGKNKVQLNLTPQYLVVPVDLRFTAEILIQSAERFKDKEDGSYNPLKGLLRVIPEPRIGAVGVTDPDSGTAYTGTAVNYFLFSRPGYHIKVAYRRGTNRSPMMRSYQLDKGQWGIGFDINHDIGCKFIDFRGTFFAKGSA